MTLVTTGLCESEVPSARAPGIGYILGQNEQACPAPPPSPGAGHPAAAESFVSGHDPETCVLESAGRVREGARCPCPALSHSPAMCVATLDSGSLPAPSPTLQTLLSDQAEAPALPWALPSMPQRGVLSHPPAWGSAGPGWGAEGGPVACSRARGSLGKRVFGASAGPPLSLHSWGCPKQNYTFNSSSSEINW